MSCTNERDLAISLIAELIDFERDLLIPTREDLNEARNRYLQNCPDFSSHFLNLDCLINLLNYGGLQEQYNRYLEEYRNLQDEYHQALEEWDRCMSNHNL